MPSVAAMSKNVRSNSGATQAKKLIAQGVTDFSTQPENVRAAGLRQLGRIAQGESYTSATSHRGAAGQKNDAGKITLGKVLQVAAPVAGALIPGVGTLGAMAIGGLGNAGGQLLNGGKFNLGQMLLAGGGAALGNKVLGNGLGSGPGAAGVLPGGAPVMDAAGNVVANAAAGGNAPGIKDQLLSSLGGLVKKPDGSIDFGKILGLGAGALGIAGAHSQDKAAEAYLNAQLEIRRRQLALAEEAYNKRAPLRDAAYSQLGTLAGNLGKNDIFGGYLSRRGA